MIILKILYLLCRITIIIKVSDSQQITIPATQGCPIFQQIPYNSVQQNFPVLIQPSNNNNHYLQTNTAQNIIPNDLAKVVISKILSSPNVHKYLDPNTRHCRQSDIDLPKHGCDTVPVPHVTNNYFIVPPEYLKLNNSEVASETITPKLFKRVENDVTVIPANTNKHSEDANKLTETTIESNKDNTVHNNSHDARILETKKKKQRRRSPRQRSKKKVRLPVNEKDTGNDKNNGENSSKITTKYRKFKENKSAPDETLNGDSIKTKNSSQTKKSRNNNTRKRTRQRKRSKKPKADEKAVSSHVNETNEKELSSNMDTVPETELNTEERKPVEENNIKSETDSKAEYLHTLHIVTNKNPISFNNFEKSEISKPKNDDSRVTGSSKENLVVRDFNQKFPEVPETLVRNMLSYLQSQLQKNFATNFFYPGGVPFGFEQLFQMPQLSNQGWSHANERKNKGKNRRRKQKHRKGSNKRRNNRKNKFKVSKSAEVNDDLSPSTLKYQKSKEKVTTEAQYLSQIKEPRDSSQKNSEEISELLETPIEEDETKYAVNNDYKKETEVLDTELSIEEIDIHNNIDEPYVQEIYEEDGLVPTAYSNRLIDDYYPIFTDNHEVLEPDEYYVKKLNNRYYYTMDNTYYEETNKPYIYEEIKKPQRTFKDDIPTLLKYNFKDNSLKHTYFDADREGFKNLARELPKQLPFLKPKIETQKTGYIEETGFKSPPGLEFPDFITRKVEKPLKLQEYPLDNFDVISKFENLDYQPTNSNSELFSNALKENGGNKRTKSNDKPKDIETVYAKSKVVKYGADREYENIANVVNEEDDHFNNERISYVLAKSLASPDEIL